MSIKFYYEAYSPIPPHVQLIDRIKLGLLTGQLRPGDTLPSIRDVETELGLSRNIVRRAYLELEVYGILKLRHGKGVIVNNELSYSTDQSQPRLSQQLCQETLMRAREAGFVGTSFARMLYQAALEQEKSIQRFFYLDITESLAKSRADQISRAWQITIVGMAMDNSGALEAVPQDIPLKILTSYYRYGEVSQLVGHLNVDIIPIALRFTSAMSDEMKRLGENATVVIVLDEHDFASYGGLILANYQRAFTAKKLAFKVTAMTTVNELKKRLQAREYNMLIMSNKLWDDLPADFKRMKGVTNAKMEFDAQSSEPSRLRAGILV